MQEFSPRHEPVQNPLEGLEPYVEHAGQHTGLLLQLPIDKDGPVNINNQMGVLMLIDDLFASGVDHIELLSPLPLPVLEKLAEKISFPLSDTRLTVHESKYAHASIFLRDEVFLGKQDGRPAVALSLARSDSLGANTSDMVACLKPFHDAFSMEPVVFPLFAENGNVVTTRSHILTLRDTISINQYMLSIERYTTVSPDEVKHMVRQILNPSKSKTLTILDEQLGFDPEIKQTVFHLDLALSVVCDQKGQEHILIASPLRARTLLDEQGVMSRSGKDRADAQKWKDAQSTNGMNPYSTFALDRIGTELDRFFAPENYDPLAKYLGMIKRQLISLGFGGRIHDVPALLWSNEYQYLDGFDPINNQMTYSAPFYSPVNGIPLNVPGKERRFVGVGGIKIFDEDVKKTLGALGVTYVPVKTLLSFGFSGSGLRCLGFPVPTSLTKK